MQDTRLIQLLKSFTVKEIKRFADFIRSPYFNKNEKVMNISALLISAYPDFKKNMNSEEEIWNQAVKGEAYDYFKFRNYISDILALALEFLKMEKMQEKNLYNDIALLENLRLHRQIKIYEKEFQKIEIAFGKKPKPDAFLFLQKYWLKLEESIYYTQVDPNTRHGLTQDGLNSFIEYMITICLDFYGLMMHEKLQNQVDYKLTFFEEILSYAEIHYDKLNTTTQVYADIVRMMQDLTQEDRFEKLLLMLRTNHDKIPFGLLERGYIHLVDFCAWQINVLGNNTYMLRVHEVNKDLFLFGIQSKDKLVYLDFVNITKVAATVKDFEWLDSFIEEYLPHLDKDEQENCYYFSKSFIAYYKNDFNNAAKFMSMVHFKNHIMKIQVKQFTIRFLYEEHLFEQVLTSLETFAHYLRREAKLPAEMIRGHEKFISYAKELVKTQLIYDKHEKKMRREELGKKVETMESNYFGTKNWLKKKLELPVENQF